MTGVSYLKPNALSGGKLSYFQPLNSFQAQLYYLDESFLKFSSLISVFPKLPLDAKQYAKALEGAPKEIAAAEEMFKMATSSFMKARLKDDELAIYSPKQFVANVSLNFVDPSLGHGVEFLMTPEMIMGTLMRDELIMRSMSDVYGRLTLQLMEGIGYSTWDRQNINMFELSRSFRGPNYSVEESRYIEPEMNGSQLVHVFDHDIVP